MTTGNAGPIAGPALLHGAASGTTMDISVILPVVNERVNLEILIPRIEASLEREKLSYEIVVVDGKIAPASTAA